MIASDVWLKAHMCFRHPADNIEFAILDDWCVAAGASNFVPTRLAFVATSDSKWPNVLVPVSEIQAPRGDAGVVGLHEARTTSWLRAFIEEGNFGQEVADIVAEVSDDKTLPKAERKRLQVEHASTLSRRARLIKLSDKICNLRDVASSPPKDWPLERKREYFDWAKAVVDGVRGVHPELERIFDEAYKLRP